jgi:hypothetical protein
MAAHDDLIRIAREVKDLVSGPEIVGRNSFRPRSRQWREPASVHGVSGSMPIRRRSPLLYVWNHTHARSACQETASSQRAPHGRQAHESLRFRPLCLCVGRRSGKPAREGIAGRVLEGAPRITRVAAFSGATPASLTRQRSPSTAPPPPHTCPLTPSTVPLGGRRREGRSPIRPRLTKS